MCIGLHVSTLYYYAYWTVHRLDSGVVSVCRLKPAYGYHTTPPQPNHNVTPTHIVPEQHNP